jgi:hypothetical protein
LSSCAAPSSWIRGSSHRSMGSGRCSVVSDCLAGFCEPLHGTHTSVPKRRRSSTPARPSAFSAGTLHRRTAGRQSPQQLVILLKLPATWSHAVEKVGFQYLSLRQNLIANFRRPSLRTEIPFGFKRVWPRRANHRDFKGGHFRSLMALCLFPSEPGANRFALKRASLFSGLSDCRKRTFCRGRSPGKCIENPWWA